MGQYSDFEDLMDSVRSESNWVVVDGHGNGAFKIIPPDRSKEVIHVKRCTDATQMDNIRCRLRRAGFPPLIRNKTTRQEQVTTVTLNGKAAPQASVPRDLVGEARGHINQALEALSA